MNNNRKKRLFLISNIDLDIKNGASRHFEDLYQSLLKYSFKVEAFARKRGRLRVNRSINQISLISIPNFLFLKLMGTFITLFIFEIFILFLLIKENFTDKINLVYLRQGHLDFGVLLFSYLFKIPFIVEVNGILFEDLKENRRKRIIKPLILLEKINFTHCVQLIVVTSKMKEYYQRVYPKLIYKIAVIPNGYYFSSINNDTKFKIDSIHEKNQPFILLYLGNLHLREGVQLLLQAVKDIKNSYPIRLFIIGEGRDQNYLFNLSKDLSLSNIVNFYGAMEKEKYSELIDKAHICYAPLISKRNTITGVSPIKVFEYLAYKKPIITSRIEGLEFIEKNKIGLLCQPDNVEDLVEKTKFLLNDYDFAIEMGIRGYKYIRKYHNWDLLTSQIVRLIHKYSRSNNE